MIKIIKQPLLFFCIVEVILVLVDKLVMHDPDGFLLLLLVPIWIIYLISFFIFAAFTIWRADNILENKFSYFWKVGFLNAILSLISVFTALILATGINVVKSTLQIYSLKTANL